MEKRAVRYLAACGVGLGTVVCIYLAENALGINGGPSPLTKRVEIAVFAAALVGVVIARFRARGMAAAMFATAVAQGGAALVALAGGLHEGGGGSILDIIGLNLFFALMFAASGQLFRSAARAHRPEHAAEPA